MRKLREETDLTANPVQEAIRRAVQATKGCVERWKQGKRVSQPEFTSWSMVYDKRSATFYRDHVSLSTINGRVECDFKLPADSPTPYEQYVLSEDYEFRASTPNTTRRPTISTSTSPPGSTIAILLTSPRSRRPEQTSTENRRKSSFPCYGRGGSRRTTRHQSGDSRGRSQARRHRLDGLSPQSAGTVRSPGCISSLPVEPLDSSVRSELVVSEERHDSFVVIGGDDEVQVRRSESRTG